jgi:hypothetical protein
MIGREYFVRQALTLLRMAKTVRDPAVSAELLSKAATFDEKAQELPNCLGRSLGTPAIQDKIRE